MLRPNVVAAAVFLALGAASIATNAAADVRTESAAYSAMQKAQKDFVGKKYAAGIAKLQKALKACGAKKCSDEVRANLLRDLGAQQLRKGNKAGAKNAWTAALKLVPSLTLSATYDVPDVRQAFDETNGGGGGGKATAGAGGAGGTGGEGTSAGASPGAGGGEEKGAPPAEKAEKSEGEKTEGEKTEGGEKAEGEGEKPAEGGSGEGGPKKLRHFWVGLAGSFEFMHLAGAKDLCVLNTTPTGALGLPKNNENYYCTYDNGSDFPPRHLPTTDPNSMINSYLVPGQEGT